MSSKGDSEVSSELPAWSIEGSFGEVRAAPVLVHHLLHTRRDSFTVTSAAAGTPNHHHHIQRGEKEEGKAIERRGFRGNGFQGAYMDS